MHPILKAFIPTANLIQKSSPFACEVVLHDLSNPQRSVVYVAGDVTGRKVGQSFDHLVSEVLNSKNFKDDYVANYFFAKDEKLVKSSTAFIRDEHGEIIGAICVNVDASVAKSLFEMAGNFLKTSENEPKSEQNDDVTKIVLNLIDKIIAKNEGKKLKKEQKLELVGVMNEKGIFNIKGAIEVVASKLNVSKITIYGYLDQLKKKRP